MFARSITQRWGWRRCSVKQNVLRITSAEEIIADNVREHHRRFWSSRQALTGKTVSSAIRLIRHQKRGEILSHWSCQKNDFCVWKVKWEHRTRRTRRFALWLSPQKEGFARILLRNSSFSLSIVHNSQLPQWWRRARIGPRARNCFDLSVDRSRHVVVHGWRSRRSNRVLAEFKVCRTGYRHEGGTLA